MFLEILFATMSLQALVSSLELKIEETEKKYEETSKHAMEAESKIIELKTAMQRFICLMFLSLYECLSIGFFIL